MVRRRPRSLGNTSPVRVARNGASKTRMRPPAASKLTVGGRIYARILEGSVAGNATAEHHSLANAVLGGRAGHLMCRATLYV